MVKTIIVLLTTIIVFNSCTFLVKTYLGVHKPKKISEKQIKRFLDKNDNSLQSCYILDSAGYNSFLETFENDFWSSYKVYDKDGFEIHAIDTSVNSCIGNIYDYIRYLNDTTNLFNLGKRDALSNPDFTQHLTNLEDKTKIQVINFQKKKFTVVVFWASFMGKYSKQLLNLEKACAKNQNGVQFISINTDIRKEWTSFDMKKVTFHVQ